MSKLSREEKLRRYHAIYDQIYLNPRIHVHEISKNVRMARNTVSSYLEHMYNSQLLFGPELRLKYYTGLNEYFYLVKVDDPYGAVDELQRDPRITYVAMFLGDWNVMFISDKHYAFSHVNGFENLLFKGERHDIITPRVFLRDWRFSLQNMKRESLEFDPNGVSETVPEIHPPPDWDDEEWTLFYEYKYDFRKKVTPVLRKHLISSDKFYQWLTTLPKHVHIQVRFYPDGYGNYTHFGFFFKTEYTEAVSSLLSNLPTSISSIHVDGGLIIMLSIKSDMPSTFNALFATIHKMKTSGMVESFYQAIGVIHYPGSEE